MPYKCMNITALLVFAAVYLSGCNSQFKKAAPLFPPKAGGVVTSVAPASYLEIQNVAESVSIQPRSRPRTRLSGLPDEFRAISLDEAIGIAMQDTEVLRSLAATVVSNTPGAISSFDPAIQSTDPNFGAQAALSQFDTNFTANALYANNDDTFNNLATNAFGTAVSPAVQQDLTTMNFGLNKRAVTGTLFEISSDVIHDNTDSPSALFGSSWTTNWEATVTHPLLQGSGILFNRIAGPNTGPGFLGSNGYLVSRTNYNISVSDFEASVREMVLEIINAYWQLDLAYRNFETVKSARDTSLETWNISKARLNNGLPGGEADREAQARAQYYQFESQLDRSLNGIETNGSPGVLQAEANLRRLLNLPQSDMVLLKPSDEPTSVETLMVWDDLVDSALNNRLELKEQEWRVKQNELLLLAARNFTLPRLDAIATYRNNGFGDSLIGSSEQFEGALNEAFAGNFDEFEFGFAFNMPIGFRQAYSGVRNAQLRTSRERAILREIKQQIVHDLGSALRIFEQSYKSIELADLQRQATQVTVDSRKAAYKADAVGFEDLLDSQQRLLEAELEYHRTKTDYELAHSTLHSQSGRLLSEFQIQLMEEAVNHENPSEAASRYDKLQRAAGAPNVQQFGFLGPQTN